MRKFMFLMFMVVTAISSFSILYPCCYPHYTAYNSSSVVQKVNVANLRRESIVFVSVEEGVLVFNVTLFVGSKSYKIDHEIDNEAGIVKAVIPHGLLHGEYNITLRIRYSYATGGGLCYNLVIFVGYLTFLNVNASSGTVRGSTFIMFRDSLLYPTNVVVELTYLPCGNVSSILSSDGRFEFPIPDGVTYIKLFSHGGYIEATEDKPMIIVHDVLTLKL